MYAHIMFFFLIFAVCDCISRAVRWYDESILIERECVRAAIITIIVDVHIDVVSIIESFYHSAMCLALNNLATQRYIALIFCVGFRDLNKSCSCTKVQQYKGTTVQRYSTVVTNECKCPQYIRVKDWKLTCVRFAGLL